MMLFSSINSLRNLVRNDKFIIVPIQTHVISREKNYGKSFKVSWQHRPFNSLMSVIVFEICLNGIAWPCHHDEFNFKKCIILSLITS